MKSGGEGCQRVFWLPAAVKEHSKENPELEKDIEFFCSYGDGYTCTLPSFEEGSAFLQQRDFCDFQKRVENLELRLRSLHRERMRWAEKTEALWKTRAEKLGTVRTVTTQHHSDYSLGTVGVSIHIPKYSTHILLNPYVQELGGKFLLDSGFMLWFDTPRKAEQWLQANLAKLPRVFSGCSSRLSFVPMERNRHVDDVARCWVYAAGGKQLEDRWQAWTIAWHPLQTTTYAP